MNTNRLFNFVLICGLLTSLVFASSSLQAENKLESKEFKTGSQFEAELGKGIGLIRTNVGLRELVDGLQKQSQIAILIDPRLDPSKKISVNIENVSLELGLNLIADQVNAKAKRIHNCIVLIPTEESQILRTLIEIHSEKRAKRRLTFQWDTLSTPQEILESFQQQYGITIENTEAVPHDLWNKGVIPDANAVETLAIILSPFDLFFEWTEKRNVVRIIPMPESASISKRVNAGKFTQKKAKEMVLEIFPEISIKTFGKRTLEINSTIDNIEQVERLLSGKSNQKNTNIRKYVPLERRRYDLRVNRKPAIGLIKSLATSGVNIQYDEALLRENGIDLDKQLTFDVKKATIQELMKVICDPIKLDFSIKGETISLFAKK